MLDMEAIKNFSIDKYDWQKVKFGDVVFEPKESVKDPITERIEHVVGLDHIDSEDIHLRRSASIEESTTFTKKFDKGDVLFGRRRAYLKKAAQASFGGICSGDITVMRVRNGLVLPVLLPFIVNNDKFFDYAITHSAGGLSPRVKFKDLANYEFHLPPIEIQRELIQLFNGLDECNEADINTFKKLNTLRFKVAENFFVKGAGATNVQKFHTFNIPKNWDIKTVSQVATVDYGISKSVANNKNPDIGWQIITGANIALDGSFDLEKKRYIEVPSNERFLLRHGDLMFNWRSGSPAHIGKTALFNLDGNYTYASFILRVRCGERLNNRFGFYLFNFLREIEFYTKNTAKQVNFKLNAAVFRAVNIPIPTIEEQLSLVRIIDELELNLSLEKEKLHSNKILKNELCRKVF
jgi:type I restriction enzyme S subunit